MTNEEIEVYRLGYSECRQVLMVELRKILSMSRGHRQAIDDLLDELEQNEGDDHWKIIQEEEPEITSAEYDAGLKKLAEQIREHYYRKDGILKLRLVQSNHGIIK